MRKFTLAIAALVLAAFSAAGFAQVASSPFSSPFYYATSFNLWGINSNVGNGPNVFTWYGSGTCRSAGQNLNFFVFSTTQPVLIADSNMANSEVVTPTAITNTTGTCGFAASPSHTHYTYQVRSGTAGLQESVNALKDQSAWPVLVLLDRNWWSVANQMPGTYATAIIGAATGDATVMLEDITTAVPTFYVWTGSAFSSTAANWQNTAPTIAAGAAAGTSPTVANTSASTALIGQANVTAGTATTTGTLFTEAWPSNSGTTGSFQYAGSCTVTSVGTNSFTAFTVATSFTSSHRVLTVTATSAPTASTAYSFAYNCK